jgi:polyphosphate kinase
MSTRKKPGETKRGQERPNAYENLVERIQLPGDIIIEVMDKSFKPISNKEFNISVETNQWDKKTNEQGIIKIPKVWECNKKLQISIKEDG